MHRPNLILRRHGPMTFALGYIQDGVWIDHLAAENAATSESAGRTAAENVTAIDVIHQLISCCADPVVGEVSLVDREDGALTAGTVFQAVAGTAPR